MRKRRVVKGAGKGTTRAARKNYLRIALPANTFKRIKALADKSGCTPFEMCVTILEKQVSDASDGSGA